MSEIRATFRRPFHVMAKPVGPACNLACSYCFYLEKGRLYPPTEKYRMPEAVLEVYIRDYLDSQETPEVHFAWQGGEPTLLGLDFFRRITEIQRLYADGRTVTNAFQTNGVLLNDDWGEFLAEHHFLVGLSVDGPRHLHNAHRVDRKSRPTFDRVMRGLEVLKKHRVDFNTLTVVNRRNAAEPLEVYRFLTEVGAEFLQFIPLVERAPDPQAVELNLDYACPPRRESPTDSGTAVTASSVTARQWGRFLTDIFDEWVRRDVGRVFVQHFDNTLASWHGVGPHLCVFSERCGNAMIVEHNGDVYACDHYMYPDYLLGNVTERRLEEIANDPRQVKFGSDKWDTLPRCCLECAYRFACNGECPKHRFIRSPDGEAGLNYLCAGYKHYFEHVAPAMKAMSDLLSRRQPPAMIMEMLAHREHQIAAHARPGPNDPCPCGSGRKFKKCCGSPKRGGDGKVEEVKG